MWFRNKGSGGVTPPIAQKTAPEPDYLSRRKMIEFYGGDRYKAEDMLCRAALLGEKPEVPWDWDEAIANFYVPVQGLAWAIAHTPQVFTTVEISSLILKGQYRW